MEIEEIINAIRRRKVRVTDHADEEANNDKLTMNEIFSSVFSGELIEDYPDDKPYPSCLIYGDSVRGMPVHSVWAYNVVNSWAVLITVYRPDPKRWKNWRDRKRRRDNVI